MKLRIRYGAALMALLMALSATGAWAEELSVEAQKIIQATEDIAYKNTENVYIASMQVMGDVCYGIRNGNSLYAYDAKAKAWRVVLPAAEGLEYGSLRFINTDEALMAMDAGTGEVFEFVLGENVVQESRYQIPWDNMTMEEGDYSYTRQINTPCIKNGMLYMLVQNDNYEYDLHILDLATMACEVVAMPGIYADSMVAIDNGVAIATWGGVHFYNTATKSFETIFEGSSYPAIAQYQGKLYLMESNQVWSNRDGDFAVVGYAPAGISWSASNAMVLGGTTFLCQGHDDGMAIVGEIDITSGTKPKSVLRIVGNTYSINDGIKAFVAQNPDVPVVTDESVYFSSAQELVEHMRGSTPADIYIISLQEIDLTSLARKDYALPLDSALLPQSVYPAFEDALKYDGQLYAIPASVDGTVMGYAPRFLETFGLTEEMLPKTYDDLLELVEYYQQNYADAGLDVQLVSDMQYYDVSNRITRSLLIDTEMRRRIDGEEIRFNSPALLNTLQHVKDTDFTGFYDPNGDAPLDNGVYYYDEMGARALMTTHTPLLSTYSSQISFLPLLLSVDEEEAPIVYASMYCAIINPASSNIEEATALFKKIAENYEPEMKIMLMSDQNEPVINEDTVESLPRFQAAVQYIKEQVAQADEQLARELEDYVDIYESSLTYQENNLHIITAEAIAAYRSIAQYIVPRCVTFVGSYDEELDKLMNRFAENSLDAQGFLKELDRRVQMMALEGD